jgi:hypothetical protein
MFLRKNSQNVLYNPQYNRRTPASQKDQAVPDGEITDDRCDCQQHEEQRHQLVGFASPCHCSFSFTA